MRLCAALAVPPPVRSGKLELPPILIFMTETAVVAVWDVACLSGGWHCGRPASVSEPDQRNSPSVARSFPRGAALGFGFGGRPSGASAERLAPARNP